MSLVKLILVIWDKMKQIVWSALKCLAKFVERLKINTLCLIVIEPVNGRKTNPRPLCKFCLSDTFSSYKLFNAFTLAEGSRRLLLNGDEGASSFPRLVKRGFTLAEVLITLVVIGVVASVTMPILTQNYNKKITETRLKSIKSFMPYASGTTIYRTRELMYEDPTKGCRSGTHMSGNYCGLIIMLNNWTVPDDYPKKLSY